MVCEPIIKLLKKDAWTKWTEEYQTAFAIKNYLSNPLVMVSAREGSPLFLYLSILDSALNCVLGQHDETKKKEKAIDYIRKKFTPYEYRYTLLEDVLCFDLACKKAATLSIFLYYIPHFWNGPAEVHLPEGDADRKVCWKYC